VKAGCDKGLYNELAAPVGFEDNFLDSTCGAKREGGVLNYRDEDSFERRERFPPVPA